MNRVLLIGKFSAELEELNRDLSEFFKVQISSDNPELAGNLLDVSQPDIVVISLIGMTHEHTALMNNLKFHHQNLPVICVGTENEQSKFTGFFREEQFTVLKRPVNHGDVAEKISQILKSDIDMQGVIAMQEQKKKKCILVVDDNAIQLRAIKDMLPPSEYEVLMANSGSKAIGMLGKHIPDLIILDYEMPVCDGRQTLEMIREIDEVKETPVVFLTGVNDSKHIQAVIRMRPAAYILKPASKDTIMATIKNTIGE